jgi:hypothetical protein
VIAAMQQAAVRYTPAPPPVAQAGADVSPELRARLLAAQQRLAERTGK